MIYARQGIRCNALCPGPVLTPMLAKFLSDDARRQRRLVHIPMGRFGDPAGDRQRRAVPGERRVELDDRSVADHRRRDHRGVRHAGMSATADALSRGGRRGGRFAGDVDGGRARRRRRRRVPRRRSTTAGGCSPRPIRTHRPASSPPRRPGSRGCAQPAPCAVPEVVAVADEPVPMLVLEWIDVGRGRRADEAALGAALAALHDAGAPSFGREDRRTTGSRAPAERSAADVGRRSTRRAGCCRWPGWPRDGRALARRVDRRAGAPGRLAGALRRRRTAGPPARRPVGRQPARRRSTARAG